MHGETMMLLMSANENGTQLARSRFVTRLITTVLDTIAIRAMHSRGRVAPRRPAAAHGHSLRYNDGADYRRDEMPIALCAYCPPESAASPYERTR